MKGRDKAQVARRDFLRALSAGAGIAVAGAAAPAQTQPAATDDKRKSLYRETEHIKTFYRVNRYPAKR